MVLLHTQQTVKYFRGLLLIFLLRSFLCSTAAKVAPAAVWVLDYCLTFEHEVRLFTSISRWNIVTVMFVIARYSPILWIVSIIYVTLRVGEQSVGACLTTYRAAGVAMFLILMTTEGLLLIRTLALWHDNRKIKRSLLAIYLLVLVSLMTCSVLGIFFLKSICVSVSTPSAVEAATEMERLIMGQFVSSAVFELAAIVATLYHSIRTHSTDLRTVSKLVSTLWRGSLLYALSLLAISVANIATISLPISESGSGPNGIFDMFQCVLHSVLASRTLFDLRAETADWKEEHNIEFTSYVSPSTDRTTDYTHDCLT